MISRSRAGDFSYFDDYRSFAILLRDLNLAFLVLGLNREILHHLDRGRFGFAAFFILEFSWSRLPRVLRW